MLYACSRGMYFVLRIYCRLVNKQRTFLTIPTILYNRRLSQLDIPLMDVSGGLTAYVIADQFTDRRGKVEIYGVYIFCYEAVLQCPVGCFPDEAGFGI